MFSNSDNNSLDVKEVRVEILQFLKTELQKYEGGEAKYIEAIQLFIAPAHNDLPIYRSAVHYDDNKILKNEIQRLADDYDIQLPSHWELTITVTETLPQVSSSSATLPAGVRFLMKKRHEETAKISTAGRIKVIIGESLQPDVELSSKAKIINIGRGENVVLPNGFTRKNHVAFTDANEGPNKYVSRRHAHIEWSEKHNAFLFFADEGGIPPANKTKVRSNTGIVIKLHSTGVPHVLQHEDEILLGEQALIQFVCE